MLSPEERQLVATQTRTIKIIVAALMAGPLAFLTFVVMQSDAERQEGSMALLAAGFAAMQVVLALIVPRIIAALHRRAIVEGRAISTNHLGPMTDAQALLAGLQVRKIIAAALLEGAAFFNIVAYQSERAPYSLAIAMGLVGAIALLFPLRTLVEDWLERELRVVNELRVQRR